MFARQGSRNSGAQRSNRPNAISLRGKTIRLREIVRRRSRSGGLTRDCVLMESPASETKHDDRNGRENDCADQIEDPVGHLWPAAASTEEQADQIADALPPPLSAPVQKRGRCPHPAVPSHCPHVIDPLLRHL